MKTDNLKDNAFPLILAAVLVGIFGLSACSPHDWGVWKVEMTSVLAVFFALLLTSWKFRFSNMAYFIVSLWLAMHAVGAHYTFELVPFGAVTETFGFERNHYDRLAHFVIGFNAFGVAEFFLRKGIVNSAKAAAFVGVLFIMALANAWELIEWGYAAIDGGAVGAAFLGSQGDVWDAQKDMLADTLGALCSVPIFLFCFRKAR